MNKIKVKLKSHCELCGCVLKKQKTFLTHEKSLEGAKTELHQKIQNWQKKYSGKNYCRVCKTIVEDA